MDAGDRAYLERCLVLAGCGRRTAAPNPVVGAVVVRDGRTLGEGWHERPGGEHAEAMALRAAGDARGATVYVSLEPCAHHGRTPACADALIAAGVARVVIGSDDPDPRTDGRGAERLRAAGIHVEHADGELARRARRQNAPFRMRTLHARPHVTYKVAVSADGCTAPASGERTWVSSPESRSLVHELRARAGAVAVGIGTVLADDPLLTARDCEPPAERQPLRVVFDRRLRLPPGSTLARTAGADQPVLVVGGLGAAGQPPDGVDLLRAAELSDALRALGRREVDSLLLEGGATLATSFLDAGLIDRVMVFRAPIELGPGGPGMFLREVALPEPYETRAVGPDILTVSELREV